MDFGTKPSCHKKMNQMTREAPLQLNRMMQRYWKAVYENAIQSITDMGAVDTGALRQSIRIVQNATPMGINFEVAATTNIEGDKAEAYIVAGGGGVGNPKHGGREVDYAEAVHDGYFIKGQKKVFRRMNKANKSVGVTKVTKQAFSGWVAGRPFLTDAIARTDEYLKQLLDEYGTEKEKMWEADQPMVNPYSMPMPYGPGMPLNGTYQVNP